MRNVKRKPHGGVPRIKPETAIARAVQSGSIRTDKAGALIVGEPNIIGWSCWFTFAHSNLLGPFVRYSSGYDRGPIWTWNPVYAGWEQDQ